MKNFNLSNIIRDNINEVSNFVINNIDNCKQTKNNFKLDCYCPYCQDPRKRLKMVINLDWANFKCYRCSESGSIIKLFKFYGIDNEFKDLLSEFNGLSTFNIQQFFKSGIALSEYRPQKKDNIDKKVNQFIKDMGLISINKLVAAKKYALNRLYNDINEIESYLVDDKYIYIPLIKNNQIISFMGRLYIDDPKFQKYLMFPILDDSPIGFFDDVLSNITSNTLYITEGYFDSFAINYSLANYVSICTFGKGKINNIIHDISQNFSYDTNVILTFDSIKKDKNIYESIVKFGEKLINILPKIHVCELPESDPSDILKNDGPIKLKEILEKYRTPFIKYKLKGKILK